MNQIAKELSEAGKKNEMCSLTYIASVHDGAKNLIEDIYKDGYIDGFQDALKNQNSIQKNNNVLIIGTFCLTTGLVIGTGLGGYFYKKYKKNQKVLDGQEEENVNSKASNYSRKFLRNNHTNK